MSWVNYACNEESLLQDIKSKMVENELPSRRELQNMLRFNGLSKRQAEKIAHKYEPEQNIFEKMASL